MLGLCAVDVEPLPKFQFQVVAPTEPLVNDTFKGAVPELGVAVTVAITAGEDPMVYGPAVA